MPIVNMPIVAAVVIILVETVLLVDSVLDGMLDGASDVNQVEHEHRWG